VVALELLLRVATPAGLLPQAVGDHHQQPHGNDAQGGQAAAAAQLGRARPPLAGQPDHQDGDDAKR
jgi:hypothetical protein